jgi:hypothetical protein
MAQLELVRPSLRNAAALSEAREFPTLFDVGPVKNSTLALRYNYNGFAVR